MKRFISKILLSTYVMVLVCSVKQANATTYFSWNGENGYQYMGSENAYPGGGHFSRMGGNVSMPAGIYGASNCTPDTDNYHYSIISDDVAGQGSVPGSLHSLKTPYLGVCPNEAFQRDTTVITTPILYEGYIRWYQKWTGPWPGRTVQQKFTKFYDGTATGSGDPTVEFTFEANRQQLTAFMRNTEGHFNKDGVTRSAGSLWVHASSVGAGTPYPGQNRSYDDYNNGINNGADADFLFGPDRWYAIEIHWKVNTDANTSDGVLEEWVDGVKVFGVSNYKYFNTGARPYINTFELQHVYYNRSTSDQSTYMDNIKISDTYIGLETGIKAPTGLKKINP